MKRLIAGCAATAIVYIPLALYLDSQVSPTTPAVILIGGVTGLVLAVTMISSTRGWSLRAVGLFLYLSGIATLLIGGWIGYQWGLSDTTAERVNDAILSTWIVGCPLSLMGAVLYALGGDRPPRDGES